jgi:hypothetical protein
MIITCWHNELDSRLEDFRKKSLPDLTLSVKGGAGTEGVNSSIDFSSLDFFFMYPPLMLFCVFLAQPIPSTIILKKFYLVSIS